MNKFIRLTELHSSGAINSILINTSSIQLIQKGEKGKDTYIKLMDKNYFFVKETIDQIEEMLLTDRSRPPIVMDAEQYKIFSQDYKPHEKLS